MYLQMNKAVKAFDLMSNKTVTVDVDAIAQTGRDITAFNKNDMHTTGLTAPSPEKLHIIGVSYYKGMNKQVFQLCVTPEVLADAFVPLIKVKQDQKFEVLQDTTGHDNNYSSASTMHLKKGDILLAPSNEGTSRGDYFFKDENNQSIHVNECRTPHPHAPAYLNPAFFKLVA